MVPPKAVSVANGYSATEDLIKKELENNESLFFNKKKGGESLVRKKKNLDKLTQFIFLVIQLKRN